MTSSVSKITVVEDFRDQDGGPVFTSTPDFHNPIYPAHAEFIFKASQALTTFRKQWREEHADGWAKGIEMDVLPVMTDGMIMGYMVLSEIDGESYDFVPTEVVETESEGRHK